MKKVDKEIVYMFAPQSGRDLKRMYPELTKISEFKGLTQAQLRFVWWHSNRTSPLYHTDNEKSRVSKAYEEAFGLTDISERDKWASGLIPDLIKVACRRMEQFDGEARSRAKIMVEKVMRIFEDTLDFEESDFLDSEMKLDINKKRAYIETCAKIADKLPDLVAQLESGYGITEHEKAGDSTSKSAMDYFHSIK